MCGAPGLTLAAGAVLHELHVIDCVRCLENKSKREEVFSNRAAAVFQYQESLWKPSPARRLRAQTPADRSCFSRRHRKGLFFFFPQPLKPEQMELVTAPGGVREVRSGQLQGLVGGHPQVKRRRAAFHLVTLMAASQCKFTIFSSEFVRLSITSSCGHMTSPVQFNFCFIVSMSYKCYNSLFTDKTANVLQRLTNMNLSNKAHFHWRRTATMNI